MPNNELATSGAVAAPSRLRTWLDVVAAIIAVALSVVILALLASTPAPRAHHGAPHAAQARP